MSGQEWQIHHKMSGEDWPAEDEMSEIEERSEEGESGEQQADGEVSASDPHDAQKTVTIGVSSAKPVEATAKTPLWAARKPKIDKILKITGRVTLAVALLLLVSLVIPSENGISQILDWVMGWEKSTTPEPTAEVPMEERVSAVIRRCFERTDAQFDPYKKWIAFEHLKKIKGSWKSLWGLRISYQEIKESACGLTSEDGYRYDCIYRIMEPEMSGDRGVFPRGSDFKCTAEYLEFVMNFTLEEESPVLEFPFLLIAKFDFINCIWTKDKSILSKNVELRLHMILYLETFLERYERAYRMCLGDYPLRSTTQDSTTQFATADSTTVTHHSSQSPTT